MSIPTDADIKQGGDPRGLREAPPQSPPMLPPETPYVRPVRADPPIITAVRYVRADPPPDTPLRRAWRRVLTRIVMYIGIIFVWGAPLSLFFGSAGFTIVFFILLLIDIVAAIRRVFFH